MGMRDYADARDEYDAVLEQAEMCDEVARLRAENAKLWTRIHQLADCLQRRDDMNGREVRDELARLRAENAELRKKHADVVAIAHAMLGALQSPTAAQRELASEAPK